jgi:hypothetical protein
MTARLPSGRALSGADMRRLLQLRRRLRDELVRLPRARQRDVLLALARARHARLHAAAAVPVPPEMTPAELRRELKWRIDAAGLAELEAGARVLDRAQRVAAARIRREARSAV